MIDSDPARGGFPPRFGCRKVACATFSTAKNSLVQAVFSMLFLGAIAGKLTYSR